MVCGKEISMVRVGGRYGPRGLMNHLAYREDAGKPRSEPEVISQGISPAVSRSADLHPVASVPLQLKSVPLRAEAVAPRCQCLPFIIETLLHV